MRALAGARDCVEMNLKVGIGALIIERGGTSLQKDFSPCEIVFDDPGYRANAIAGEREELRIDC